MVNPSIKLLVVSWIIALFTYPIAILIFFGIYVYRLAVLLLSKIFHPEFHSTVTGIDVGFSTDNFWKSPRGAIAFVHEIDGRLDSSKIKEKLKQILFSTCSSSSSQNYERLTTIFPKIWLSIPFWSKVSVENKLKIQNHIKTIVPDSCRNYSEQDVNNLIKDWLESPFRFECPLWDVLLMPGFQTSESKLKSVFAFRIHHIVGDGYSMLQFLKQIFDDDAEKSAAAHEFGQIREEVKTRSALAQIWEKIWIELNLALWTPFIMLKFTHDFFFHNDWFAKKKSSSLTILTTTTVRLEELKKIRTRYSNSNASINTIILHLLGGALRRYLGEKGEQAETTLPFGIVVVCSLPIVGENHPVGKFCNHWNHCTFKVPANLQDGPARMNLLISNVGSTLQLNTPKIYARFAKCIALLPTFLLRRMIDYNVGASIGLSNLPGPSRPVTLFGQKASKKLAIVGIQLKHASMMITVFSYNGDVSVSLTAHRDVIPNEEAGQHILSKFVQEIRAIQ